MRLNQLRDYIDALILDGVDPNIPVCIHESDPVESVTEVTDAILLNGGFSEDPTPKMCGFLMSSGTFLLLRSNLDYEPLLNARSPSYIEIETIVEAPEKSWPHGHWFSEPRRLDGKI